MCFGIFNNLKCFCDTLFLFSAQLCAAQKKHEIPFWCARPGFQMLIFWDLFHPEPGGLWWTSQSKKKHTHTRVVHTACNTCPFLF